LRILDVTQIPNPVYAKAIATASQVALQVDITHHGTVANNEDSVPTSINLYPQQFYDVIANIPPTIHAPIFVNPMGEFFRGFELVFSVKSFQIICSSPPSLDRKMKPLKYFTGGFSRLKRILRASQTWKLLIGIFVRWRVL
jgi:hypothetical protein